MLTQDRHRYLLQRLEESGSLQMKGLDRVLGVATMTLWRDLRLLEEQGLLKRVRGGAIRIDRKAEPEFALKQNLALAQKRQIAAAAVCSFIKPGDVIVMEGGTTVAELLNHLPPGELTIMTNSLPILSRAYAMGKGWKLHSSGGSLSPVSGNFVGPEAVKFFSNKCAQFFFMSGTGLDPEAGILTDPNPVEIQVKQAMAKCVQKVILLMDSSKIGVRSVQKVLPLDDIDCLLIDDRVSAPALEKLRAFGLKVSIC